MLLFLIVIGLVVGSFLNVLVFRLKSGEDFLISRSHCMNCHHELAAKDLIPVLSFVWLQGKCRYCQAKLSYQYPLVELLTALSFVLLAANLQFKIYNLEFFILAVFICILIVIAVFDYKYYLILDKVVFPALALSVLNNLYLDISAHQSVLSIHGHFTSGIFGAILVSGFFLIQYALSKGRWIGLGDVKLGLFLGSLVGLSLAGPLLLLAYCLGAVVGVGLIAMHRKALSSRMPFGTFLGFSAIIILLYGTRLLHWYLHLIGL